MKTIRIFVATIISMILTTGIMAQVSFPVPCKASFTVSLDSLTSYPFLYHFKDHSNGDINSWLWDFGDGETSTELNPSHQYQNEGNYQICLTVRNLNSPDSCNDQACHGIITEEYYSLGGLVYTGDYPLNNPLPEGDTGVAALYRIKENQVTLVEEQHFSDYGYYWFGYVLPGSFLVKVSLTPASKHYGEYFTTYQGDKVNWTQAGIINLQEESNYDATIHLIPVKDLSGGTGLIKGFVNFEQGGEYSVPPFAQTTVILSDKDKIPLIYTYPDAAGYFQFSGVPFDTYFVSADATGKPSTMVSLTLTESAPVADGINLTIFGGNIYGVPEDLSKGLSVARIYPNPIRESLNAEIYSHSDQPVKLTITDTPGKTYYSSPVELQTGISYVRIPVASLPPGLYLLSVIPEGNTFPVMVKFIK
jgi:hypothetical protein